MTEMVRLIGKSRHGKNRIQAQGDMWRLAGWRSNINTVKHRNCPGPFALLESTVGINTRWVSVNDDPDFEMEIIR